MNRIEMQFKKLKEKDKKALITYITAGDPDIHTTEQLIYAKERAGAHIIEIGIPFSDPLADGPVIQRAAQRALERGITLQQIFDCVDSVRAHTQIPLVFLVYYNTILAYGVGAFINKCEQTGIDGLIIPDLPLEEREEILPAIQNSAVALIPLVSITSRDRISAVVQNGRGFVYCISSLGVTGVRQDFREDLNEFLGAVRQATDLPLAIGFGISTREDIERFSPYVDAVIVGSAIVQQVEECGGDVDRVEAFVKNLVVG